MAGAITQTCLPANGNNAASNVAYTITNASTDWSANVSAADVMVVALTNNSNALTTMPTTATVTDDDPAGSNIYTLLVTSAHQTGFGTGDKNVLQLFVAPIATGGRKPVLTVHVPATGAASGGYGRFAAFTVSGIAPTLDRSATGTANQGSTTVPTGTTAATTAAGQFGVALATDCGNNMVFTDGSGAGTIGGAGFTKQTALSMADANYASIYVSANPAVASGATTGGTVTSNRTVENMAALVAVFKLFGFGTGAMALAGSATARMTIVAAGTGAIAFAGSGPAVVPNIFIGTGAMALNGTGDARVVSTGGAGTALWTRVQGNGGYHSVGGTTVTVTLPSSPIIGNKLIAAVTTATASAETVVSVADGGGNQFTLIADAGFNVAGRTTLWAIDVPTPPNAAITAIKSGSGNAITMVVSEFSGLAPGATVTAMCDGTPVSAVGGPGVIVTTDLAYATHATGELVVAVYGDDGRSNETGVPYVDFTLDPASQFRQSFATTVHSSGRYLLDANANPFLLVGDSSWDIAVNISSADADFLLHTRAAQGFNTNLLSTIVGGANSEGNAWDFAHSSDTWATFDGIVPFFQPDGVTLGTGPGNYDPTQPNPAYWARIDHVIATAKSLGMTIELNTFGGAAVYEGSTAAQAWFGRIGQTKWNAFGTWIANRYVPYGNVMFLMGDDFNQVNGAVVSGGVMTNYTAAVGIAQAMVAAQPGALITSESNDGIWFPSTTPGLDLTTDASIFTTGAPSGGQVRIGTNTVYDARPAGPGTHSSPDFYRAYNHSPPSPAIFGEGAYEGDVAGKANGDAPTIRAWAYCTMLSGGSGWFYGDSVVWHNGPGYVTRLTGQPGQQGVSIAAVFFRSVAWWRLVPDQTAAFVTTVNSAAPSTWATGPTTAAGAAGGAAAVTTLGDLGLVYCYRNDTVVVAMTAMRGTVTARWFDPTNGTYAVIGTFAHTGTHTFSNTGTNSSGDTDWLLVLTA